MTSTGTAPDMPTIYDIGLHIRRLWDEHNRMDELALRAPREQRRAAEAVREGIRAERDRWAELVMDRTARTLSDTVVQLAQAFYRLDSLTGSDLELEDPRTLMRDLQQLQHVTASVLPVIANAAGLDLGTLGNGDLIECLSWHRVPARDGGAA